MVTLPDKIKITIRNQAFDDAIELLNSLKKSPSEEHLKDMIRCWFNQDMDIAIRKIKSLKIDVSQL